MEVYSTKRQDFRQEILTKSVLAGTTPLFIKKENGFNYQIGDSDVEATPLLNLDIETSMPFEFNNSTTATYYPRDNETISFVRPQLVSQTTYGAYVKYCCYLENSVPANVNHELTANEWLVVFYKTEDSEGSPYVVVKYDVGKIIQPSFTLSSTNAIGDIPSIAANQTEAPSSAITMSINQSISINKINQVVLENDVNYIYVIADKVSDDETNKEWYVLKFNLVETVGDYDYFSTTVQGEQQFIYTDSQKSYLSILGSGTKITVKLPHVAD